MRFACCQRYLEISHTRRRWSIFSLSRLESLKYQKENQNSLVEGIWTYLEDQQLRAEDQQPLTLQ